MPHKSHLLTALVALVCVAAAGDTIYLKNGARFDGIVHKQPNGIYSVTVRGNTLLYRPEEIERVEENDKTGAFNREEAYARWAERDAELTEKTGLNSEQRKTVKELLYQLQTDDTVKRREVRDQLVALQQQMDVYKFLDFALGELSHRLSPWVLEAMFYVDQGRVKQDLEKYAHHEYYGTRAKALALMGMLQDPKYTPIIAQGLVDGEADVKIQAAYALASVGARQATPALIATMRGTDLRLRNACQLSLEALWKGVAGDAEKPKSPQDWLTLWNSQAARYNNAITLADLKPLIDPKLEYQDE